MAITRWCIDTTAYSHFRRGDERVVSLLDSAEWIGVPAVVIGELWLGSLLGTQRERNQRELREFMLHPVVQEVPIDGEVAHIWGEIIAHLRRSGSPLPTNDVWVAATAIHVGATVLTYDRHFESIPRARVLRLASDGE